VNSSNVRDPMQSVMSINLGPFRRGGLGAVCPSRLFVIIQGGDHVVPHVAEWLDEALPGGTQHPQVRRVGSSEAAMGGPMAPRHLEEAARVETPDVTDEVESPAQVSGGFMACVLAFCCLQRDRVLMLRR
jgi:hypothetical protein